MSDKILLLDKTSNDPNGSSNEANELLHTLAQLQDFHVISLNLDSGGSWCIPFNLVSRKLRGASQIMSSEQPLKSEL